MARIEHRCVKMSRQLAVTLMEWVTLQVTNKIHVAYCSYKNHNFVNIYLKIWIILMLTECIYTTH